MPEGGCHITSLPVGWLHLVAQGRLPTLRRQPQPTVTALGASHNMANGDTVNKTTSGITHDQEPEGLVSQWGGRCIIAGEERLPERAPSSSLERVKEHVLMWI